MVNTSVVSLVRSAYPTRELVGVPRWVETERYDVNAKTEGNSTREQITLMLQALLADRFKLAVHDETRELPVFALIVVRGDLRHGQSADSKCCAAMCVDVRRRNTSSRRTAHVEDRRSLWKAGRPRRH